jgi:hypothetical protein
MQHATLHIKDDVLLFTTTTNYGITSSLQSLLLQESPVAFRSLRVFIF